MRNLVKSVLRRMAGLLFRVRVAGALPDVRSRLLVVANHESFLDGLLLGLFFLVLEARDLLGMLSADAGPWRSGWLSAFFALIPLHGLHVAAGCLWLAVMLVQMRVFGLTTPVKLRLMRLSLFWHFLDIIWIGIFSVVYLEGLA